MVKYHDRGFEKADRGRAVARPRSRCLYRPLRNRLGARVYARDCGIVWGNNAITLFFYKNLAFYENEQRLRNAQKLRTCTCLEHPEAENVY